MAVDHRISWTKANVTINGETHERHRFFFDGNGEALVHNRRGELVAKLAVDEVLELPGPRQLLVKGEGTEWSVTGQGCGCGG